jgi:4'-phosphopantetheinyl transferase
VVPITFGRHGKPLLAGAHGLGFNLSHSGDFGLLAVGRAAHVGADVEEIVARGNVRDLARSVCSAEEQQSLDDVDVAGLLPAFLTCWTRKEAVLKALGTGLVLEPRGVNVGIVTARVRVDIGGEQGQGFVVVESITCDDQCVGAVAVAGGMSVTRVLELNALGVFA